MAQPNINDFDLLNPLGSGSYSTVYKAKQKSTRQYFAIKSVTKQNLSKSSTDNLLQEIKLLKTLKHKYIVEMIDFRWDDKNIYIIMELCDQGDLSAYIKSHKTLPETTCKFFLRQLALALQYMRQNDISHFDLKPQNLLLTKTPNMTLKVADFGFAQHLELGEANTTIKGSPLYMAPEILLKHKYDPSADLWSIGVILYECLFGHAPYRSKNIEELLLKISTMQKIDIPKQAKLSAACRDFLVRLLVHEPRKRMSFTDFFDHEFLDLLHEPTDENLSKAIELFTKAVELDNQCKYMDAYHLYCEGLQYFVPLIGAEVDSNKKKQLRDRADTYLRRAEEIKTISLNPSSSTPPIAMPRQKSACLVTNGGSNVTKTSVQMALTPTTTYNQLYLLCASSPAIQNGLEIGRQAELYVCERNFQMAIDNFRTSLSILVPILSQEPKGQRQELLHAQIKDWMKEAECTKTLLSAHNLEVDIPATTTQHKSCSIQ